jgi:hypothetical protein
VLGVLDRAHGARHAEAGEGEVRARLDGVVGQRVDPAQERRREPVRVEREPVTLELRRRHVHVAGRDRVFDYAGHVALIGKPLAGSPVQVCHAVRREPLELAHQQAAEEVVVAKPAPVAVERDHEQVRALELEQHLGAVPPLGDGVGERAADALEDRRAHEELPYVGRLAPNDLVPEVVDEVPRVDGHPLQETGVIGSLAQRKRGEIQPGHPSLHTALERREVGRRPPATQRSWPGTMTPSSTGPRRLRSPARSIILAARSGRA